MSKRRALHGCFSVFFAQCMIPPSTAYTRCEAPFGASSAGCESSTAMSMPKW